MRTIPLAPLERIMRKAGAERVSSDAVEALRDLIEEKAVQIAEEALRAARHANRRTIKREDIELVIKK